MSKEFVLIKNEDGSGDVMLRAANIVSVEDYPEEEGRKTIVTCREPAMGGVRHIRTTSTAAEVFAAVEVVMKSQSQFFAGRLGVVSDTHFSPLRPGSLREWRGETGEVAVDRAAELGLDRAKEGNDKNTIFAWDGAGTGFPGYAVVEDCICTNFAGQHRKCPKHGEGTAWRDLHGG
jgi:hypothetical protein